MKKNVTSKDVAKEAGVSRATVSYVLNDVKKVKIKPETRERVMEAARKLNYHPHSIARALKTDKSMSIGVVSRRNIAEDRFSIVLRGIKDALKEHKYSITLCNDEEDLNGNREYINYYLAKRIDGVILLSAEEVLSRYDIEKLISRNLPNVLVDYHLKDEKLNTIDIDYFHGGYLATRFLIEQGYDKIIYFAPAISIPQEKERLRGVRTAISEFESKVSKFKEVISGQTGKKYMDSTTSMLENKDDYTAAIISWVDVAYKALAEASKLNISVPEDLAVISLAGTHYADLSYPKLSTCDLPLYNLGYESGKLLIKKIKMDTQNDIEFVQKSLSCFLNPREST